MLLGKRVLTPDGEQGFISDEFTDNTIDVEILEDDAETAEHTTTINYELAAISIPDDQSPQLQDITPFGQVVSLKHVAEGIIEADIETGFDGRDKHYWLSDARFRACPDEIEQLFGNWTASMFFSQLQQHFGIG